LGNPTTGHIDRVSNPGEDPGLDGTGESPFEPGDPSGFNVGCSVVWFVPDHDPADGEDTSFLYFGWDVADLNLRDIPTIPVQYDADGDGSACRSSRPLAAPEFANEFYIAHVVSCADLNRFDPTDRNTNGVFDFATRDMRVRMNNPGSSDGLDRDRGLSFFTHPPIWILWNSHALFRLPMESRVRMRARMPAGSPASRPS
jgi:hypothetical protein